ncbi:hypothetical protein [Streptomyces sp. NBC_01207]|uniref:hypothetical protein n=1 Tax=Streptomyces sp. NBC_01207 TaxID=2903772 RepID=UPI002E0FDE31|nr:hypothetical protein OG457_25685 [Streptomyces sp. NBC_01207]
MTGEAAPVRVRVTTTAVAGAPVARAEGDAVAVLLLLQPWLFFLLLEREHPATAPAARALRRAGPESRA